MTNFTQLSQDAASNFLQSIVFIDDKAYQSNDTSDQHDFNAKEITKVFSENGKVCAVYEPSTTQEIDSLITVAKKADVAVIDWQIVIDDQRETEEEESDDEADADIDDVRGIYTKKIINQLLLDESCKNSIKLILVYTGETDLEKIAIDIHQSINDNNLEGFNIDSNDSCTIVSKSCRIMVIAKSNREEESGQHADLLRSKRVTYAELPVFITQQFSSLTSGLLSNFAMASLSEVRRNFNQILSQFSKKLDAAYLAHQSLLPNTHDANELLIELLGSTFMSTLRYKGLNQYINNDLIEAWLMENVPERQFHLKKSNGDNETITFSLSHNKLMRLLGSHDVVETKYREVIKDGEDNGQLTNKRLDLLASKFAITLFTDDSNYNEINHKFANLCQHRNIITNDSYTPSLTLGTVVKSTTENNYYICIQQRCDSVRLNEDNTRRFLFLSLTEVTDSQDVKTFDFLTPTGTKLKVNKGTYALRTVKFNGSSTGTVPSELISTQRLFYPTHHSENIPEAFQFIVELKEMYAQKIIEEYSGSLSRVGLDEPEWVRRYN
ncbi:response regulator receiver domain [Vibrio coralliirubri]|uniref:response regulator receiver domain n=1 Tax=Vibrio coralliirubri TaxID=1516159 RepID=UPI000A39096D|nr:response regulator receiver domain [Vibrio coralliirubri]